MGGLIELGSEGDMGAITWLVFIYFHTRFTKIGAGRSLPSSRRFFVLLICYLGVNLLGTGFIVMDGFNENTFPSQSRGRQRTEKGYGIIAGAR
jgi:hypothetical protein